jgi:hypothetical protein
MYFGFTSRRCTGSLILFVVTLLAVSVRTEAQVISWSLDNTGAVGGEGAGDHSGVSAVAGVVPAGNWTNSFPSNLTRDLQDSTGVSTLLDINIASFNTYRIQGSHPAQDANGSWNKEMLNGYLNAGPAAWGPPITYSEVVLNQIPYSSYDVYVYFSSDVAGRTGDVTNLSTTYSFNTLGPASIAGANATFAQTTDTLGSYTTAANYAIFSGLSGNSQTMRVQMLNNDEWAGIAGFQVVNTGAAPTPPIDWKLDAGGNWNTGTNWVGDTVPGAAANVRLGNVITADRTVTLNISPSLNSITFDNPIGDGDYFLAPSSIQTLTLTGAAQVVTFGRSWLRTGVAGSSGMNTLGNGELILDAANSFSGSLNVNETSVAVTKAGAIPVGSNVAITNGGAIRFFGSDNGFYFDNGTGLDPNSSLSVPNAISISADSFVDVNDGADVSFNGILSGDGSFGAQSGANVTLQSANTYTGVTNVNGATVRVTHNQGLGSTSAGTSIFNDGTVVLSNVNVGNEGFGIAGEGQLQLNSATVGASAGSALITLGESVDGTRAKTSSSGSNTINSNIHAGAEGEGSYYEIASDSGTLTLSGTLSAVDAAAPDIRNYVFSGNGDFNLTGKITDYLVDATGNLDLNLSNTGDNISVIKRGTGKLTINTASASQTDYWQLDTVVEQGTLEVISNGSNQGELWSDSISVGAGAFLDIDHFSTYSLQVGQNLGGAGTVVANTLQVYDDNSLSPGDSVGTLHISGNMAINHDVGGGSLNFELSNDKDVIGLLENDLVTISGSLTTSGAAAFSVNVLPVEHALESGATGYRLISHGGGTTDFSGSTAKILHPTNPNPADPLTTRQSVTLNSLTAGQVNLVVSGAVANQTWTGSTDAVWNVNNKTNWSGTGNVFFDLDNVTFGASGSNKNVNVAEAVVPGVMTVTGTGANYSFSGSSISAANVTVASNAVASFDNTVGGNVTVQNTATLGGAGTFENNVTTQAGGKLRVGAATMPGSVGVISWNVDNNGTIGGAGAGSFPPLTAQAGVVPAGGWSNTFPNNPTTDLRDDSGNATTLDIAPFSNSGTWNINNFTHAGQDTNGTWNKELLTGYLNSGAVNGAGGAGVAISGIPYAEYDIIVYFNSDNNTRTGTVSDGTSTYSFRAAGAAGSFGGDGNATFFQATASTTTSDTANYAIFSNLTGATRTITVDIPTFGGLAGFQVVGDPTVVSPAGETMFVLGNVSLAAGSTVSMNIAGSGISDLLDISGSLSVANGVTLEVLLDSSVSASSLTAGNSWNLFDFGSSTGVSSNFALALPAGLSSGLEWDTSNLLVDGTISVVSSVTPGDFDFDGDVDGRDFLVWQRNPSVGNLADWQANYGTGVGPLVAASTAGSVPEPTSACLFALGLFGLAVRRKG